MGILDQFAVDYVAMQKREAEIIASLPKTKEEADERFRQECGEDISSRLYDLRHKVEEFISAQGKGQLDYISSDLADETCGAILDLQMRLNKLDLFP